MKRQIERMERELKEKENVIQFMNNEQKIKDTDFSKSMHVAKEKLEKLEQSVNTLKAKNKDQEEENDYVRNLILDNNLLELYDETSNQFTADTIECVMNLQNNNISASKIGEVIRTVCSLCKRQPNRVPSATTVNRISDMKLYIATKQVEDLSKKSNLTLYSDETSKFGKSFEVFAVTDEDKNSYLLGLREMSCKSSETVLETFKDILQDFNELCDGNDVEQLCKLVDESKSVATVESTSSSQVSLLVGKTIRHKFAEGTFIGNVISVVPGFGKWYNVTYDGDPAVYVYQLQEDYADGNIEIVVRCLNLILFRNYTEPLVFNGNKVYQCRLDLLTDDVNELDCQLVLLELKYKRGTAIYEILNKIDIQPMFYDISNACHFAIFQDN
ncbi:unnamed protein product [Mytilus edulis]|uniref:Uncharacterized protein n=1 Tax=Mytilus edulis TaxID=6550 RepID=A0A8S3SXA2_MYTED|nr:unnamed protein product [Mytilus edulis]